MKSRKATRIRVQPCLHFAGVGYGDCGDGIALKKLGLDSLAHPSLIAAERWLLDNQILGPGDWQVKNRKAAPGGWAFEFQNDFYPDVDDTAFVLMALGRVEDPDAGAADATQ